MNLEAYIADPERKAALVADLRMSPIYLWQLATSWQGRRPSPELSARIERATGGAVRCEELRPDIPWTRGPNGEPLIDAIAWGDRRKEAA